MSRVIVALISILALQLAVAPCHGQSTARDHDIQPEDYFTIANVLDVAWDEIVPVGRRVVVVGNIPFYITGPILRLLAEHRPDIIRWSIMMQREVAERASAEPGQMSLLALSVQIYGEPRIMGTIPAQSFFPRPEVDSAVQRIDIHSQPLIAGELTSHVFRLARAGFGQKRKQLRNSLAAGLGVTTDISENWLRMSQIDPKSRAQELGVAEWKRLAAVARGT